MPLEEKLKKVEKEDAREVVFEGVDKKKAKKMIRALKRNSSLVSLNCNGKYSEGWLLTEATAGDAG